MDPFVTSSLISAGGQLLGGLFGRKQKKGPDFDDQLAMNESLIENTADATMNVARKHGIHPSLLFGGGINSGVSPTFQFDNDPGFDYEALGQNVGRVADAWATKGERAQVQTMNALSLERAHLENQLLASQISSINRSSLPPRPSVGESVIPGQSGMVDVVPSQSISHKKGYMHEEAGDTPIYKRFPYGKSGKFAFYGLSQPATESAEGYGHVGGTVFGAGALLGSVPLYIRDAVDYYMNDLYPKSLLYKFRNRRR